MTQSPFDSRVVYSLSDPALERHTPDEEAEYRKSLDVTKLRIRAGATPVKITVRPADSVLALRYLNDPSDADTRMLAARACIESVELPNGERLTPKKTTFSGVEIADEEWLRTLVRYLNLYRVTELAYLCITLSALGQRAVDPLLQWAGQPAQS